MRSVHLALYADVLAARASRVAAELERTRGALRQAAIEREARGALDASTLARVERLGVLTRCDARRLRTQLVELAADLAALRELQAWTEARLAEAGGSVRPRGAPSAATFRDEPRATTYRSRAAG
ncbi:MAG: hypothetical protein KY396_04905 [Actinobacteria bacterium]|nr:hypothetical protein [Actinomycetota bacterium]